MTKQINPSSSKKTATKKLQALRGMNDFLPQETAVWGAVEAVLRQVFTSYGYQEVRTPMMERTELFTRSIGEVTDIVEKEMYTMISRSGKTSMTLRPEGTAGCVRMGLEHGFIGQGTQRLWYIGPMFRYEAPQKGRYRQFHQAGLEVFGIEGPDIDSEIIALSARLWQRLGISAQVSLQINSIGTQEERQAYRVQLVDYFNQHLSLLDEDSLRRLQTNPLRILDSKNPAMQDMLAQAPYLIDHLGEASQAHFDGLKQRLDVLGIAYEVNPRIVRGLDYYSNTVFEWVTTQLGAQGAVCGGGRYDGLVAQFGAKPVAGIGFAIGLERLIALVKEYGTLAVDVAPQLYFVAAGDAASQAASVLAEQVRNALPNVRILQNMGGGNLKKQFSRADQSGAQFALVLGEDEITQQTITIKPLRDRELSQICISQQNLVEWLATRLSHSI